LTHQLAQGRAPNPFLDPAKPGRHLDEMTRDLDQALTAQERPRSLSGPVLRSGPARPPEQDPMSTARATSSDPVLVFEPLGPEHARFLFPVLGDVRVWEHVLASDGATEEQMRTVYARRAAGPGVPGERWINHAVRLPGGPYLGRIEATVHVADGWAEIAYLFGLDHRGRGHARGAVRWLLEQLEVDEVWTCTAVTNVRSRRLLEALGFRQGPRTRPLASWDPGDLTYRWARHR